MRILLDTHTFLWWLAGDPSLSPTARDAIDHSNTVYVSAASAWEIVIKHRLGRLPGAAAITPDVKTLSPARALLLSPSQWGTHSVRERCQDSHKDPFDRMLIAQAVTENCVLISNEIVFDRHGVARLW